MGYINIDVIMILDSNLSKLQMRLYIPDGRDQVRVYSDSLNNPVSTQITALLNLGWKLLCCLYMFVVYELCASPPDVNS